METNQYSTNPNQNQTYRRPEFSNPGIGMASASLILGMGALVTMMTVFFPFILGGLAIIFALLSKGYGKKMIPQAKIGFGCGIAGLSMVVILTISSYAILFSNPEMLAEIGQQYDAMYEEMYGNSAEEQLGMSFEDMFDDMMEDYSNMLK